MPLSEQAITNKKKYSIDYAKRKYKRIPLDVTHEKYDAIKIAACNAGESINEYIKKAIDQRISC